MKKKTTSIVLFFAMFSLSAYAFDFNAGTFSPSSFSTQVRENVQEASKNNELVQKTRNIKPVQTIVTTVTTTIIPSSGEEATAKMMEIGESTHVFQEDSSSSKITTSNISIKGGASTGASGTSNSLLTVPATCGKENFDDAVRRKFGAVDLNSAYVDSKGAICILKTKHKVCKESYYTSAYSNYWNGYTSCGRNVRWFNPHTTLSVARHAQGSLCYYWVRTDKLTSGCGTYGSDVWYK